MCDFSKRPLVKLLHVKGTWGTQTTERWHCLLARTSPSQSDWTHWAPEQSLARRRSCPGRCLKSPAPESPPSAHLASCVTLGPESAPGKGQTAWLSLHTGCCGGEQPGLPGNCAQAWAGSEAASLHPAECGPRYLGRMVWAGRSEIPLR